MFTGLWEEKAILQYSRDHLGHDSIPQKLPEICYC